MFVDSLELKILNHTWLSRTFPKFIIDRWRQKEKKKEEGMKFNKTQNWNLISKLKSTNY